MSRLRTWQLFAICVLTWATTWHAVTYQIASFGSEASVAWRFGVSGALVLAACAWRGLPLRLGLRDHLLLALQGSFLYGVAYLAVYHAELHVPSGLVAVGYSASPLLAGLGAWALFGLALRRRFLLGGVLGIVGVGLIFWPEFGKAQRGDHVMLGAAFTAASVLLSAVGSLAASRNRSRGVPFWPALGYGMLYGAAASLVLALALGQPLVPPAALSWWLSFLYLVLAGSILTFACFLTLQDRIGPGPSGSIGVMTPLLALLVSIAFEGYRPDLYTALGAALAVAGNALMLLAGARRLEAAAAVGAPAVPARPGSRSPP